MTWTYIAKYCLSITTVALVATVVVNWDELGEGGLRGQERILQFADRGAEGLRVMTAVTRLSAVISVGVYARRACG